jgi:hypothetical protein
LQLSTKSKIKSRPIKRSIDATEANIITGLEILDIKAQLPVTKLDVKAETVRTLTRMFPSTTAEYAAKPLDWRTS